MATTASSEPAQNEMEALNCKKRRVALLSVLTTASLSLLKVVVGILSGSVGVLAEGFHSGLDMIAAIVAFVSVKHSSKPPDKDHMYGHGKFEGISGAVESLLILIATAYVAYESARRLFVGSQISYGMTAISVMALSVIVNWVVSTALLRTAKESQSLALEADGWHLRSDAYTSVGVFIALILVWLTKVYVWDVMAALTVAGLMVYIGWKLFGESWRQLTDASLPRHEIELIERLLVLHAGKFTSYHKLRTRRSGPHRFIDLHLVVDKDVTVEQAHELCDHLERRLREELPGAEVTIHVEPSQQGQGLSSDGTNATS